MSTEYFSISSISCQEFGRPADCVGSGWSRHILRVICLRQVKPCGWSKTWFEVLTSFGGLVYLFAYSSMFTMGNYYYWRSSLADFETPNNFSACRADILLHIFLSLFRVHMINILNYKTNVDGSRRWESILPKSVQICSVATVIGKSNESCRANLDSDFKLRRLSLCGRISS